MNHPTFLLFYSCIYWRITLEFTKNETSSEPELVFAHVVYRHGDRAPGSLYPTDPHGPENWPMGLYELTREGMMQQYRLGKYLRKRYSKLLNERYLVDEIYVQSSNANRALQSAATNLAGLYPPRKGQIWNPQIPWQPIPIHSVELNRDFLLQVGNPCPTYDDVFLNQTKDIIDYYNHRYAELFDYVKNHSGLEKLDFLGIGKIYDPLYCESVHKLKLPHWTKTIVSTGQSIYDLIVKLKKIAKNLDYNSDEKALLTGGPLLGDIINRMVTVSTATGNGSTTVQQSIKPSKMVMYSAHDGTVMALLYSLNVVQRPLLVPYAAAVFIELYRNTDGSYFVEVAYKDDTPQACKPTMSQSATHLVPCVFNKEEPIRDKVDIFQESQAMLTSNSKELRRLIIPGCPGVQCPLDVFASVLSKRTIYPISKRDEYCGIDAMMKKPVTSSKN